MKLTEIILQLVSEMAEDLDKPELANPTIDTQLFNANLDSMGIVFLITDLESRIAEELGVELVLADERAMSQRTSPYRSVKTLAKYAQQLIDEAQAG